MPWQTRNDPWQSTGVRYCDVTGQLLPQRHWTFEHDGRTYDVTNQRCETIFREYVLARRTATGQGGAEPPAGRR